MVCNGRKPGHNHWWSYLEKVGEGNCHRQSVMPAKFENNIFSARTPSNLIALHGRGLRPGKVGVVAKH